MKAFQFRLESALRWRATQNDLEKSRVAAAAKRVHDLQGAIEARRNSLKEGALQLVPVASGEALGLWSAYTGKTQREIGELRKRRRRPRKRWPSRPGSCWKPIGSCVWSRTSRTPPAPNGRPISAVNSKLSPGRLFSPGRLPSAGYNRKSGRVAHLDRAPAF